MPKSVIGQTGDQRRGRSAGWPALRSDLRSAVPDATAALAITVAIFWWLYARVEAGTSTTIEVMPTMDDANAYWMYWMSQAFGWSAMLWAWITVMFGLLRSTEHPAWLPFSRVRLERWHRTTSLTTIGLTFAHAFILFAQFVRDDRESIGWGGPVVNAFADVFVPGVFDSGTGRVAILIGLLAFYLSIPIGLAYYVRHRTGSRVWRVLHRFVLVVYVLSVWHTLLYGTSVWYDGTFRTIVWLCQLPVAALLLIRLLAPAHPHDRIRWAERLSDLTPAFVARIAGRVAVALTVVVLLAVPLSGHDGGRVRGGETQEPVATPVLLWIGLGALVITIGIATYRAHRIARSSTNRNQ